MTTERDINFLTEVLDKLNSDETTDSPIPLAEGKQMIKDYITFLEWRLEN